MAELTFVVTLSHFNPEVEGLTTDTLNEFRNVLSGILTFVGFGPRLDDNDIWGNQFAIPITNIYENGVLTIEYMWEYPLHHGGYLSSNVIPPLLRWAQEQDLHLTTRLIYETL